MIYEQTVTLRIRYDPQENDSPETWNYPWLLDTAQDEVVVENVGPIIVIEGEDES